MRYITLKEPWATLVCRGIADVADAVGDLSYRGRVLVVAAKEGLDPFFFDDMPYEWLSEVKNGELLGNIPVLEYLPGGVFVGAVDIVDCVEQSYSIWESGKEGPKWRFANPSYFPKEISAKRLRNATGETEMVSGKQMETLVSPVRNVVTYNNGKLRLPVSNRDFDKYFNGELSRIDLFIDEDLDSSGVFPDPGLYEVAYVDTVEIACENQRAYFGVERIEAGVRIDSNGDEIYKPSVFEPEHPWESLLITLGARKMWVL